MVSDSSAISFTKAFYQAIAYGRNIKVAFELGCLQIDMNGLKEHDIPKLLAIRGKPEEIVLVK